jgi:tRNA threonylcarbamoyladenosine biosynthesis protein TsaB
VDDAGLVAAVGEEQVSPASAVALPDRLSAGQPGDWAAAGRGLAVSPELAESCRLAGAILFTDLLPRAREILELARPAVADGKVLPAEGALPVYVRDQVVAAGPS